VIINILFMDYLSYI